MVDTNDDPLVAVVDKDANRLKAIGNRLRSIGMEARPFDPVRIATPRWAGRRLIWPNIAIIAAPPVKALLAWLGVLLSRYSTPWAHVLFLASIAGLGASLWPEAVPGVVSMWQAVSLNRTHVILGSSIPAMVPLLLLCTGFGYRLSRAGAMSRWSQPMGEREKSL